jgi:hypothetical protein
MKTLEVMRIAIVVEKSLSPGQVGNVAAILMGQAALLRPDVYDQAPLTDLDGNRHAGIKFSTVILKAGQNQLLNTARTMSENSDLTVVLFTQLGQGLHNAYDEYSKTIKHSSIEQLQPAGLVVVGTDEVVRAATKKFSLLQ